MTPRKRPRKTTDPRLLAPPRPPAVSRTSRSRSATAPAPRRGACLKHGGPPATVATVPVVPPGYEEYARKAVAHYWQTLGVQTNKQGAADADRGNRRAVTGGK